ncbi:MAG TPA: glycosyl hydrolase family 28-related protein [Opitutaceae bacterium]|jgi:polygalacturonase|nr:glycosyl hydrolase family 28-related protein [Opitutaceae bacterium]
MHKLTLGLSLLASIGLAGCASMAGTTPPPARTTYNVRDFGATGDGKTLDTDAINKAIDAAAAGGGGTVVIPAGTYACYSIHLQSNVGLYLDHGSTILAADAPPEGTPGGYDTPEPNSPNDKYEDFGHSHFHNSLVWGENLHDISITGPGIFFGNGLSRGFGRKDGPPGQERHRSPVQLAARNPVTGEAGYPNPRDTLADGVGNKTIALKNCRNVIFRDFTIFHGGHFGLQCNAVDNFTIENLKIDTNRDGMDINNCQNVRISDCTVNSPNDDGICLKSDFALGYNRPCENITITGCQVSGFTEGTLLDGTRKPMPKGPGTGRIKFGTEGNGGFINIAISNCVFEQCQGLALETVDGALLEDIAVSNITMRDIINAPIFLRLGGRLRGPDAKYGTLKRVSINNVIAHNVGSLNGILLVGLPNAQLEDISLSHIFVDYKGGGTALEAQRDVPEDEKMYPEPGRFGKIPSYGLYARHVRGLTLDHVELRYNSEEHRPVADLIDVAAADIDDLKAPHADDATTFVLKNVNGFEVRNSPGVPNTSRGQVADEKL